MEAQDEVFAGDSIKWRMINITTTIKTIRQNGKRKHVEKQKIEKHIKTYVNIRKLLKPEIIKMLKNNLKNMKNIKIHAGDNYRCRKIKLYAGVSANQVANYSRL